MLALLRKTWIGITLLLLMLAAGSMQASAGSALAPAERADRSQVQIEIQPTADTYLASDQPSDNFSDSSFLSVRAYDDPNATIVVRSTLLRFDLDTIPADAIIQHAELKLFQTAARNPWSLDINIILEEWSAETVAWNNRPRTAEYYEGLISSTQTNQEEIFDVTALLLDWLHNPQVDNLGLELEGPLDNREVLRRFDSREGNSPPKLVVTYELPAKQANVSYTNAQFEIDGVCDTEGEYADATMYHYVDVNGSAQTLFVAHDERYLYVCAHGIAGIEPNRGFALHVDTDDRREKYADFDDLSFQVAVNGGTSRALRGAPATQGEYEPAKFVDFTASAAFVQGSGESAEFQVSIQELNLPSICGAPFGIALFHNSVLSPNDVAAWTGSATAGNPVSWLRAYLRPENNTICVCETNAEICQPAQNATVYRTSDNASIAVDANGFVLDDGILGDGDKIWALQPISETDRYTLYDTSGDAVALTPSAYGPTPPGVLRLVVDDAHPLMVHDLMISAQWNLEGNTAYKQLLTERIRAASDVLYDVTNGQFVWGEVTVHQNYENWFSADVWLYANNNLRPAAYPGGILSARIADPDNPDVIYRPGQIYIGSHWNRYNLPPGQALPTAEDVATDWERALAHEWGHYFFFQFDTYVNFVNDIVMQTDTCTGSLMGWAYFDEQTEFVYDDQQWQANCGLTVANHLLQRNEWATAKTWWPWLIVPTSLDAGPAAPPMSITEVSFVAPVGAPSPLTNQIFELGYQDGESASAEAKTFVFRNDRAFANAKPAEGSTQVELIGVQAGDRLCVMDLNDNAEGSSLPRYQFGCEQLQARDNHILLEKDTSWAPVIEIDPLSGSDFMIRVLQQLPGSAKLKARVYPEHVAGSTTIDLSGAGGIYSGTVNLPIFTPAAFVQVFVEENDTATDKRRESIIDYGVAKGGEPGPSSGMEHAPIYSSSGLFYYIVDSLIELGPGEFVAIQSTAGTQALPPQARPVVQGYRLIAFPPERAESGAINILYPLDAVQDSTAVHAAEKTTTSLSIYHWNGQAWTVLDTSVSQTQNGYGLASAESHGVGTYILTESNGDALQFIPLVEK